MNARLRRSLLMFTTLLFAGCGSSEQNGSPNLDGGAGAGAEGGPEAGAPVSATRISGPVKKLDLLLMIDNSASMADKHMILAQVVPDLVNRLVNPVCIDA